jgi:hypothetical protein
VVGCSKPADATLPPLNLLALVVMVVIAGSMVAFVQLLEQTDIGKDIDANKQVMLSHRHKDALPPLQGNTRFRLIQCSLTSNSPMATASREVDLPLMRLVT